MTKDEHIEWLQVQLRFACRKLYEIESAEKPPPDPTRRIAGEALEELNAREIESNATLAR